MKFTHGYAITFIHIIINTYPFLNWHILIWMNVWKTHSIHSSGIAILYGKHTVSYDSLMMDWTLLFYASTINWISRSQTLQPSIRDVVYYFSNEFMLDCSLSIIISSAVRESGLWWITHTVIVCVHTCLNSAMTWRMYPTWWMLVTCQCSNACSFSPKSHVQSIILNDNLMATYWHTRTHR